MKKLFFFLCCLLALSATAFAEKSEWIDPGYDFTKAKSICVDYAAAPEIADGVRDKDAQAVFFERAKADIVDKLIKAKYNVGLTDKAKGNAAGKEAANTKAVAAQSAENPRLASGDYDLVVRCTVSQYDTGGNGSGYHHRVRRNRPYADHHHTGTTGLQYSCGRISCRICEGPV